MPALLRQLKFPRLCSKLGIIVEETLIPVEFRFWSEKWRKRLLEQAIRL